MDPELPVYDLRTMRTALENSLATRRILMLLLASFATIALTLAVSGIYAVLSYLVGGRRREIGIRVALGAQQGQVLSMVLRQASGLIGLGLSIGLPAALVTSRLLASFMVGIAPTDLITYLAAALVVSATGIAGALAPARRAAHMEPTVALEGT